MNMQEQFDTVVRHLLTQNEKAIGIGPNENSPRCKYRAVKEDLEGASVLSMLVRDALKGAGINNNVEFLYALQTVHDSKSVNEWRNALREVAFRYNLRAHVLDELKWKDHNTADEVVKSPDSVCGFQFGPLTTSKSNS